MIEISMMLVLALVWYNSYLWREGEWKKGKYIYRRK